MDVRSTECTFCVMDTSDPDITFDATGRCHHCRNMAAQRGVNWFPDEGEDSPRLHRLLDRVRSNTRRGGYDGILGLSGGIDSSYLALKAHEWGLRPLVVHIDTGWNSELAVRNIERLIRHTGFELHTHVIPWNPMRELQLSYLRAGVANQDVPQDHALFAGLYRFATKNGIRYVLNGGNVATEGIFPENWHWSAMDARNLKAIHHRFGNGKLTGYPTINMFQYYFWFPYARGMTPVRPLNYLPYSKELAADYLKSQVGWRAYEYKHGESMFTKFFQNYYLPTRFGYDKRRPHLSSRIVAGELTREQAVDLLAKPLYGASELSRDTEFICRKLGLSTQEFAKFMNAPTRHATDFPNWGRNHVRLKSLQTRLAALTRRRLTKYS